MTCRAIPYQGMQRPGHALLEKGLQTQIGAGTLASSQKRRAAVVSRIDQGSTGNVVPKSVYLVFLFVRASEEAPRTVVLDVLQNTRIDRDIRKISENYTDYNTIRQSPYKWGFSACRSAPAPPRLAVPPCAAPSPTRPWCVRAFDPTGSFHTI